MQTLVDRFRKIVRHCRWIQRLGIILALLLIVLAFLAIAQQRSKVCSTAQARAHIIPPLVPGSIPNARNGAPSGGLFCCTCK